MQVNLKVVDETTSGEIYNETVLRLASSRASVRDIIEQRVRQEVRNFNDVRQNEFFSGLVQPRTAEKHLNGYRIKKEKIIDADQQVDIALSAFSENKYLLLVDDRQLDSLDDEFGVTDATKISFLKLIPMVGG